MGKAEENKQKKRNSLLTHSYKLFTTKGIDDTSISDITGNAGVAKGTFYFYFKDKQDLIDHLIARKSEAILLRAAKELKKAEKENPQMTVEDKIILVTDYIITDLSKDKKLAKFLNRNISLGFYVKAITDENLITAVDIKSEYERIINSCGDKWKNDWLMLYSIIEFVASTSYTVILEDKPISLDEFRPYLFDCIRNIIAVYKIAD